MWDHLCVWELCLGELWRGGAVAGSSGVLGDPVSLIVSCSILHAGVWAYVSQVFASRPAIL